MWAASKNVVQDAMSRDRNSFRFHAHFQNGVWQPAIISTLCLFMDETFAISPEDATKKYKSMADSLWRRANARNVGLRIFYGG